MNKCFQIVGDLSDQTALSVSKQLGFKSRIIFDFRDIPRYLVNHLIFCLTSA